MKLLEDRKLDSIWPFCTTFYDLGPINVQGYTDSHLLTLANCNSAKLQAGCDFTAGLQVLTGKILRGPGTFVMRRSRGPVIFWDVWAKFGLGDLWISNSMDYKCDKSSCHERVSSMSSADIFLCKSDSCYQCRILRHAWIFKFKHLSFSWSYCNCYILS